ncbi:MAG: S-layer family protein [Symploca sp. SIO3E6]|nr:S-layer family protein [Caldora sp. SIO3E6]
MSCELLLRMSLLLNDNQYHQVNLINLATHLGDIFSYDADSRYITKTRRTSSQRMKIYPNNIPQGWEKWRIGLAKYVFSMALGFGSAIAFSGNCALAQVTSDGTVGTTVNGSLLPCTAATCSIGGGTTAGNNLFHSFSNFTVPNGAIADFQNATNIVNIFSRVTGGVQSDILGAIQAQGNANFFLLNPSGIFFGPDAQLRIGGSFVGTTADGISFPDGGEFSLTSAVAPNNPLLTVNPSALFFNQTPTGAITNQSTVGLDVGAGQNLFLIGGNVNFDGGVVRAPGGRIELGGLAAPGEVKIISNGNNFGLSFYDDVARADVLIDNGAIVDVVANDGGDIIISASNITVSGGSNICAGIGTPSTCDTPGSFAGGAGNQAGNIVFDATGTVSISESSRIENDLNPGATGNSENIFIALRRGNLFGSIIIRADSISINGESQVSTSTFGQGSAGVVFLDVDGGVFIDNSEIFSTVESEATGDAGGVLIETGSLSLTNAARISTSTFGTGIAGDVEVTADGSALFINSDIFSNVEPGANGTGGKVKITAESLSLINGSQIQTLVRRESDTQSGGQGDAGKVDLDIRDTVTISGVNNDGFSSAVFSSVGSGAVGNAGDVEITARAISLSDFGRIDSSTEGVGNAGAVILTANGPVSITNGSDILSGVRNGATGDAGGVVIIAESLSIDAFSQVTTSTFGEGNAGLILIVADKDVSITNNSAIFSQAGADSGESGGIGISARSVFVSENSELNVDNSGLNEAGAILINAREDIILLNRSVIRATASSGNGGDVELNSGDFLLVLGQSDVFTSSGGLLLPGTGGNVDINTKFVIAAPFNDNNIAARAFGGDGGRIQITANRIFDIQERPLVFPTNDISASSPFGFGRDGIVTTNVITADPTSGFTNLPTNPVDPTTLIAETCPTRSNIAEREKNQFIITGQGGLPPDPNAAFPGEAVVNDWETPGEEVEESTEDSSTASPTPVATTAPPSPNIIEAQGWIYGENGEIIFTAQSPNVTPTTLVLNSSSTCNEN